MLYFFFISFCRNSCSYTSSNPIREFQTFPTFVSRAYNWITRHCIPTAPLPRIFDRDWHTKSINKLCYSYIIFVNLIRECDFTYSIKYFVASFKNICSDRHWHRVSFVKWILSIVIVKYYTNYLLIYR